jgi:hypothetical protein
VIPNCVPDAVVVRAQLQSTVARELRTASQVENLRVVADAKLAGRLAIDRACHP